ncbi:AsnC family transcriptional regulator [Candidatus Sumerlaeota bacterium]|nr:AsnC family transcriptional regulator [Candidatus Sumerlaeota bacterium]
MESRPNPCVGLVKQIPDLDEVDRRVLDILQEAFPLVERPFEAIGERLGVSEDEVLRRVARLKDEKVIRQIGAIFDSAHLGYQSALIAFAIDESRLDKAVAAINAHPGVSHNYLRDHAYNVWFTLTVPPESDPRRHAESLARQAGIEKWLFLPALRVFKIGVRLRMSEGGTGVPPVSIGKDADAPEQGDSAGRTWAERPCHQPLNDDERAAVRSLQKPLSIEPEPFRAPASEAGLSPAELLDAARGFLDSGVMRRFAAVLRHRQAGYTHNVMTAWEVAPERVEAVGRILAEFDEVSHCYERPPSSLDWPYRLFAMLHATSEDSARQTIERMRQATGIDSCALLSTVKEFKKTRVGYYLKDET